MLLYVRCYFLSSEQLSLTYSDRLVLATGMRCFLQNCGISFCGTTLSPTTSPSTSICYSCRFHGALLFCRGVPTVWIPGLVLFFFFLSIVATSGTTEKLTGRLHSRACLRMGSCNICKLNHVLYMWPLLLQFLFLPKMDVLFSLCLLTMSIVT